MLIEQHGQDTLHNPHISPPPNPFPPHTLPPPSQHNATCQHTQCTDLDGTLSKDMADTPLTYTHSHICLCTKPPAPPSTTHPHKKPQCTDLDGTLIEDGEDNDFVRGADESTRRCASYFGKYLAPSGGVVVFNTGRSIGMVEGLLARKVGIMPRVSVC